MLLFYAIFFQKSLNDTLNQSYLLHFSEKFYWTIIILI